MSPNNAKIIKMKMRYIIDVLGKDTFCYSLKVSRGNIQIFVKTESGLSDAQITRINKEYSRIRMKVIGRKIVDFQKKVEHDFDIDILKKYGVELIDIKNYDDEEMADIKDWGKRTPGQQHFNRRIGQ